MKPCCCLQDRLTEELRADEFSASAIRRLNQNRDEKLRAGGVFRIQALKIATEVD